MQMKSKENVMGIIFVILSAISFSIGGLLIKIITWNANSINGVRNLLAFFVIGGYMIAKKHKFVFNKQILLGALACLIMNITFVSATKITTAANAIVLQFTQPIFIILIVFFKTRVKPQKSQLITCAVVFAGIICFFFDDLQLNNVIGNGLAIISGLAYAFVFLIKSNDGADFESSLLISQILSFLISIPSLRLETDFSMQNVIAMLLLGIVQQGVSFILLSRGLDHVSAITASLTSTIEPIANPILVAAFYGETIGLLSIIGAVMVLVSTTLYNCLSIKFNQKQEA